MMKATGEGSGKMMTNIQEDLRMMKGISGKGSETIPSSHILKIDDNRSSTGLKAGVMREEWTGVTKGIQIIQ